MCGICGIYRFAGDERVSPGSLQAMCDTMVHRGPDDEGIRCLGNAGIGMRRLSIVGVADGRQPISNEDGSLQLVCNGEIYNYPELKAGLEARGHRFRTHSDAECIVHLYEEHGERCVEHLRGMFAFAVVDTKSGTLYLCRDRLGIKPLFYAAGRRALAFGSEIKAILALENVDRDMDYGALDTYFAYGYIPSPLTIFKGIRKLDAGHYLVCRGGTVRTTRYWDLRFAPDHGRSESYFVEKFREIFDETIRIHLLSEVPLGAFLSGGVDSSLVVSFMGTHVKEPVNAFTVAFQGDSGGYFDERRYAREVAARYACRYTEYEVRPSIGEIVDPIVSAFDEPFADDSVIPTYNICRLAKEDVTVVLTGLGGDELFAGYERYVGLKLTALFRRLIGAPGWGRLARLARRIPEQKGGGETVSRLKRLVEAQGGSLGASYVNNASSMPRPERALLYSEETRRRVDSSGCADPGTSHFDRGSGDLLDKAFYHDIKTYLPDDLLALSDRVGMHHSLELRVPFVDHRLVEFAATIPSALKLRWLEKKYLLKKAAAPFV
ncbi:MAG TPA: asparagine synthase (glutamine-hydrolyzing), partial [Candidatus Deferrimicrobiaceae bacterium]